LVTSFCIFCGAAEGLEIHHVVPRVMGGDNSPANLIAACSLCHDKLHAIGKCSNHKELQRIGIEKAKLAGKYKGKHISKLTDVQRIELIMRVNSGEVKAEVARSFNISRETLYQYLKEAKDCAS